MKFACKDFILNKIIFTIIFMGEVEQNVHYKQSIGATVTKHQHPAVAGTDLEVQGGGGLSKIILKTAPSNCGPRFWSKIRGAFP